MSVRCLEQCQGQIGNPQVCTLALVTVVVLPLSVSPRAQGTGEVLRLLQWGESFNGPQVRIFIPMVVLKPTEVEKMS